MGKKITTYWKRPSRPGQIITTIRRGAVVDHQWRPDLQKRGRIAARKLTAQTGINMAAVDFLYANSEKDPEPYFLEINYYFGRKGLGGSERYYELLYQAIRDWLREGGLNPDDVRLI